MLSVLQGNVQKSFVFPEWFQESRCVSGPSYFVSDSPTKSFVVGVGSFDLHVFLWTCRTQEEEQRTHMCASDSPSAVAASFQAELSCHICRPWRMMLASTRQELKKQSHWRDSGAAQILFDTKIGVFLFITLSFFPSEGRFPDPSHVWRDSRARRRFDTEVDSEDVLCLFFLSVAFFFDCTSHILNFFVCAVTFHDTSPCLTFLLFVFGFRQITAPQHGNKGLFWSCTSTL